MPTNIYLKINIRTLAAEARIIKATERRTRWGRDRLIRRFEEDFTPYHLVGVTPAPHEPSPACVAAMAALRMDILRKDETISKLQSHRVAVVRLEARAACIAQAFFRGREFKEVEARSRTAPPWATVRRLVERFSARAGCTGPDLHIALQRLAEWQDAAGEWKPIPPKVRGEHKPGTRR